MASFWMLIIGATLEYCDLPEKWFRIMHYVFIYQGYHQVLLNFYFSALGIVGGRLPMVFTGVLKYDFGVLISLVYSPIVYCAALLWVTGLYRKFAREHTKRG
eukprot:Phypoly_transcript_16767.p2 GENE.Phypoly_transcript_16767~~Phypoly_transcript_16767.p2  ORF type:complete len:102 (+),score=4.43 Phypoly_transcript_16767:465-770(+)